MFYLAVMLISLNFAYRLSFLIVLKSRKICFSTVVYGRQCIYLCHGLKSRMWCLQYPKFRGCNNLWMVGATIRFVSVVSLRQWGLTQPWQMEIWHLEQATMLNYTPIYFDSDYHELMQDERWARTDNTYSWKTNETTPITGYRASIITNSHSSAFSDFWACEGS